MLSPIALYAVDITEDSYTKFRNFTTLDGLSHNRILDIKQDKFGFIWIATAHGIDRYDGYGFKNYEHIDSDTTSLPGNYVTSIAIDEEDRLWVGTKMGLASYDYDRDVFSTFKNHTIAHSGLSDKSVRRLLADQGVLWVETLDGVLNKIDLKTYKVEHYKHKRVVSSTYDYHEIVKDSENNLWLGGRDLGPIRFDPVQHTFEQLRAQKDDPTKKRDNDIACIYEDSLGLYWMSATDGFYRYYPEDKSFQKLLKTSTYDIIAKDNDYLWLGTAMGLMEYNIGNNHFINFRHNVNNEYSLVNDHINVLFQDRNENLWIGTAKGLSVMYHKNNLITHYRHIPEISSTLSYDNIRTFLQLKDGRIWIGTFDGGILEWDECSNEFRQIEGTEGQRISTMYQDREGDVWLGMWSGKGFLKYDKKGDVTHYAFDPKSLKRDWYSCFYEDEKGRLWTGIWGALGVHFFDRERGRFEEYSLRVSEAPHSQNIDAVMLQNGKIWTYGIRNTFNRYNPKTSQYEGWGYRDSSTCVLPEWRGKNTYRYDANIGFKTVNSIQSDEKNNVSYWSTDDGLYFYSEDEFNKFNNTLFAIVYNCCYKSDNELFVCSDEGVFVGDVDNVSFAPVDLGVNDDFTSVFALSDSVLLFTSTDNFVFYNWSKKEILNLKLDNAIQGIFDVINTVCYDQDQIWFCTDKGLLKLSNDFSNYTLYNMAVSYDLGLLSDKINGLIKQSDDVYWLATNKGLIKFRPSTEQFELVESTLSYSIKDITVIDHKLWMATQRGLAYYDWDNNDFGVISSLTHHMLSSRLISFIKEDNEGHIWIGTTNNGVNRLDTSSYCIDHYLPDTLAEAFYGKNATDFALNNDGTVFISSEQGVNVFNYSTRSFQHITTQSGLLSNDIMGLAFDAEDNLWMTSPEALIVYVRSTDEFINFGGDWGLLPYLFSGEINYVNGQMLVATDEGFYAFYPNELLQHAAAHRPGFTGIKVFANEKKCDFLNSNKVVLTYKQNFFTIAFSDFEFSVSPSNYHYKLDGIDPDWVKTNENKAAYTNIHHGNYRFLLTTERNHHLNMAPIEMEVIIIPPLWKRGWFILIEVIVLLMIVLLVFKQRINKYKEREKILVIEQKLLRSELNPHFVFNALIAIQSFIFSNDPKAAGRYLSKFAKLMRLYLQNTRQDFILMSQEVETLEYYLELQQLRFDNVFEYEIKCDNGIVKEELKLPPMMAQPFIENAIEHGFKGVDYKGKVLIEYGVINNALEIIITDNGIGINQSETPKDHKSLAIKITRERLKSLSRYDGEYELIIKDLSDDNKSTSGTRVMLRAPYVNIY